MTSARKLCIFYILFILFIIYIFYICIFSQILIKAQKTLMFLNSLGEQEAEVSSIHGRLRGIKAFARVGKWLVQIPRHARQGDATSCGIFVLKVPASTSLIAPFYFT